MAPSLDFDLSEGHPPVAPLDHVIRSHVASALFALGGNKAQTARALGINRRTLYRLLARYEISG